MAEVGIAQILMQIVDKYSAPIKEVQEGLDKIKGKNKEVEESSKGLGEAFEKMKAAFGGALIVTEVGRMVNAFAEADEKFRNVGNTAGLTGEKLNAMTKQVAEFADDMGTKTRFTGEQVAGAIQTLMARTGISFAEAKKQAVGFLYTTEVDGKPAKQILGEIAEATAKGKNAMEDATKAALNQNDARTQLLKATHNLEQIEQKLGEVLAKVVLPVMTVLGQVALKLVAAFDTIPGPIQMIIVGGIALGGVIAALNTGLGVMIAQFVIAAAMNPFAWVMVGVTAVGLLIGNFEKVKAIAMGFIDPVIKGFNAMHDWLSKHLPDGLKKFASLIMMAFSPLITAIKFVMEHAGKLASFLHIGGGKDAKKPDDKGGKDNFNFDNLKIEQTKKTKDISADIKKIVDDYKKAIEGHKNIEADFQAKKLESLIGHNAAMLELTKAHSEAIEKMNRESSQKIGEAVKTNVVDAFNKGEDLLTVGAQSFSDGFKNTIIDRAFSPLEEASANFAASMLKNLGSIFKSMGGPLGGFAGMLGFADGGDFVANKPMPIMVGEGTQAERVTITPLSKGAGRSNTNNISINATIANDVDIKELVRKISYELEQRSKVQMS